MSLAALDPFLLFILVTLMCGLIGGWGGYLIERINLLQTKIAVEVDSEEDKLYRKLSFVLGVIAAFTVPAFLEIVSIGNESETLVDQILGDTPRKAIVVYSGFCLLAAVSGQSFVTKLSSKIIDDLIDEAELARKEAQEAQQISKETEKEIEELVEDLAVIQNTKKVSRVSENSIKVLSALESSEKYRLDLEELSQKVSLDETSLDSALKELQDAYMVSGKFVGDKRTWRTRSAGRVALTKEKGD